MKKRRQLKNAGKKEKQIKRKLNVQKREKNIYILGSKFILHVIIYIPLYNKGIFNRANRKELKKRGRKVTKKI